MGQRRRQRVTREVDVPRIVGRQMGFFAHALVFVLTSLLLSVTGGLFVGAVVALSWSIPLALHGFFVMVAPLLRGNLEREVRRRIAPPAPDVPQLVSETRSLEELSAAIAHEIRNPITAAKSLVQQIAEDPSSTENAEYAAVAIGELDRVERSIVHLLRFAREESLDAGDMLMVDVLQSALETLRDRATKLGVSMTTALEDSGSMRGDSEKLRRVVINLLSNALDSLEEAKTVEPRIEIESGKSLAGDQVWVTVRDNGPGFGNESGATSRIFEPFYTSKEKGSGFGLSLAKKTISAHGGTIEAKSTAAGGAELTFVLPRSRSQAIEVVP